MKHNLPPQPTSFVGRTQELAALTARLADPACRLLTLVGPGGIGKTRLALQAAEGQLPAFEHGVFLVDLAPVAAVEGIVSALASAVGFQFYQGQDGEAQQVLNYLREKRLLLVMDNFEHLLAGAALVDDILATAPGVRVLATSREPLNLRWEHLFRVQGMDVPSPNQRDALDEFSAIQLFEARARQAAHRFSLHEEQACVVRICQLVEGMPLGIELAAAWTRAMSCQQLADELARSLDLLTSRQRTPDRHASLRAVFEHSWALLSDEERAALKKLAVFKGHFAGAAARAVADADLGLLASLVDKSLLRMNKDGRYDLHELVRQFAAGYLAEDAAVEHSTRNRHSAYYCAFLAERAEAVKDRRMIATLDEIEATLDNIRAAWAWANTQQEYQRVRDAIDPLYLFYITRSLLWEGVAAFDEALAAWEEAPGGDAQQEMVAHLLARKGGVLRRLERRDETLQIAKESLAILETLPQPDRAVLAFAYQLLGFAGTTLSIQDTELEEYSRRALTIFEKLGDLHGVAATLRHIGHYVFGRQDYEQGLTYYEQSRTVARQAGNQFLELRAIVEFGKVYSHLGNLSEAMHWHREALTLARRLTSWASVGDLLRSLGGDAHQQGDYVQARAYLEESIAILRERGLRVPLGNALDAMGWVAYRQGEFAEARRCFQQALEIRREQGQRSDEAWSIEGLAIVAREEGDREAEARLHQEALAILREVDDHRGIPALLSNLGWSAYLDGQYEQARDYLEQSLAYEKAHNNRPYWMAVVTINLAHVMAALGQDPASRRGYRDALAFMWQEDRKESVVECLAGMAHHLAKDGDLETAVELLALVLQHPSCSNDVRQIAQPILADLEAELPEAVVVAAKGRGEQRDLAATVEEMLNHPLFAPSDAPPTPNDLLAEPLSERELEVLRLVVRGLSNSQIAEELFLAVGTVKTHIHNIYGKLGVHGRPQAIARAHDLGLV